MSDTDFGPLFRARISTMAGNLIYDFLEGKVQELLLIRSDVLLYRLKLVNGMVAKQL